MQNQGYDELGKIININEDACKFYSKAQEQAKSPKIKEAFGGLERLHNDVVVSLQQCARATGADIVPEQTFVGQTAQFWTDMMTKISNDVDETLVSNLEEAEDRCLHSIEEAIQEDIRPEIKTALRQEQATLQKSHDYMKSLKDYMKAA